MPEFDPTTHSHLRKPNKKGLARLQNLVGRKFNRLSIFSLLGMSDSAKGCRETHWLCRCDCGKWWATTTTRLKNGQSQSCGCWNLDKTPYSKTHGKAGTLVYRIWSGMYTRSFNFNHKSSKRYGRKGLGMCEGLRKFEDFYALMGDPPSPEHSIDRWPNKYGGYWCGQCNECKAKNHAFNMRWATPPEQGANSQRNITLTVFGITHHVSEWARIREIPIGTLSQRVRKGWPAEECLGFKEHRQTRKKRV